MIGSNFCNHQTVISVTVSPCIIFDIGLPLCSGRGVMLTSHPLLVPWSRKSRAIPLLPLWVIQPVQSLSACTRMHFFYTFMLSLICKDVLHLIVSLNSRRSSVVYAFFWVIRWRQNFICRHYGTLRLLHLLKQVGMKNTPTQHQQRRWPDLRQILETPSTQV